MHRTFSYNEVSRRYTSEEIEFYFPKEWRLQDTKNKQGSVIISDVWRCNGTLNNELANSVQLAVDTYAHMLELGIAREQARMVLPQNLYTKFVMFGNLRNWLHFCELRSDTHAQWEVQQYSNVILHEFIRTKFPWTYEIFMETHPELRDK